MDHSIDRVLADWRRAHPELDLSAMAVLGRLSELQSLVERRLELSHRAHGLEAASFDVLSALLRAGEPYELSPRHLAEASGVTTSAVAQRLNRLTRAGLVSREPDPQDGRGVRVRLTAEGLGRIRAALPGYVDAQAEILEELTRTQQDRLIVLLEDLARGTGRSIRAHAGDPAGR